MTADGVRSRRRVAVVGGGITGLAAARSLALDHGAEVELFEAGSDVGGKIRTSPFAGRPAVDEGPDAFLARVPGAAPLARAVGMSEQLVSPVASSAALWWDELHPLPSGLLLGMPTGIAALARSRLLTWRGKARAAAEPFLPTTPTDPDTLGRFVRSRFGNEVHERLVDPLVGSIYAADTDRFSLAAVALIAELASSSRSVLLAGRRRPAPSDTTPVFLAPAEGMAAFARAVARSVEAAGGRIHCNARVGALVPEGDRWRLDGADSGGFDGVVLATPAAAAAGLLRTTGSNGAADILATVTTAAVAIVTVAIPTAEWPSRLRGLSGYLVPKPKQSLVTAVSFGSQKWAQWNDGTTEVLRISLGRDGLPVLHLDDERLVDAAVTETGHHLGIDLRPTAVRVTRWPDAFPQYRPHHAALVESARRDLPNGLVLAGASYDGIGIPACVRSAESAVVRVVC